MSKIDRYPSYAACIADVLSQSPQPLSVDSLLSQIAARRPLGKSARSAVYRAISQLFQAVPVAPGRYGWLTHLLSDIVVRHPLTGDEVRRGFLLLDELEHVIFFPQFFQTNRPEARTLTIDLFGGPTVEAETSVERKTWSLQLTPAFSAWIDELGGQGKDDLLIRVIDAAAGHYEFRLNLREMRDERAIRHRNIQLALLAEETVAEDRRTRAAMPTWELVARLIGRGIFHDQPAADDLHYVLHEFSMLRLREGVGYELEEEEARRDLSVSRAVAFSADDQEDDAPRHDWDDMSWLFRANSGSNFTPGPNQYNDQDNDQDNDGALMEDDACVAYQTYLDSFQIMQPDGSPLPHDDFHLLEAELEMLVRLEHEFGRLLTEQTARKDHLAATLFIDPNEFLEGDWDFPDDPDMAEPPFWAN